MNKNPSSQSSITVEEWESKYKPSNNHIDPDASWQDEEGNGVLFETYGPELDFITSVDPHKVWTYVDGDYGLYLINGFHIVNRIGYFYCQEPWIDGELIEVTVKDDRLCQGCEALPANCICGPECEDCKQAL